MAVRRAAFRALGGNVVRALVVGLIETSLALLLAFINPFHIDEWAFERNQGVWQRIMADSYECNRSHLDWANEHPCNAAGQPHWPKPRLTENDPRPPPDKVSEGPNPPPISVFYLDENALDSGRPGGASPLYYTLALSEHQDLLEDIATAKTMHGPPPKPVAIFIDILFDEVASPGPSGGAPTTWLSATKNAGTAAVKAAIDAKMVKCAKPTTKGSTADHFGCYVAHVAAITNYAQWANADNCRQTALAKLACILRSGGIPVIFADAAPLAPPTPAIAQTLSLHVLDTVAITAPAMIEGKGYPLVPDGANGRPLDDMALTHGAYSVSPASLLYAAYCLEAEAAATTATGPPTLRNADRPVGSGRDFKLCPTLPVVASASAHDGVGNTLRGVDIAKIGEADVVDKSGTRLGWAKWLGRLHWSADFGKRLDVLWGVGDDQPGIHGFGTFPELMDRLHGDNLDGSNGSNAETDRCRPAKPQLGQRLIRVIRQAVPLLAGRTDEKPCRYIPSLPAADLDGALTDDDKRLLLDGKVVLIGGQYLRSGDWIPALETAVPGVQYHAMALANLMDLNRGYRRVEQPVISGSSFVLEAWRTFVAVFVINVGVGLAIMTLNDARLDPDRLPARARTRAMRRRGQLLWAGRGAIVVTPLFMLIVAFGLLMTSIHYLNLTVILALIGVATLKLCFVAVRPLLEEGVAFLEWLDISDRALFETKPRRKEAGGDYSGALKAPRRGNDTV